MVAAGYVVFQGLALTIHSCILILFLLQLVIEYKIRRATENYQDLVRLGAVMAKKSTTNSADNNDSADNADDSNDTNVISPALQTAITASNSNNPRRQQGSWSVRKSKMGNRQILVLPQRPPPSIGKIKYTFHRTGVLVSILQIVMCIDYCSTLGIYSMNEPTWISNYVTATLEISCIICIYYFTQVQYASMFLPVPKYRFHIFFALGVITFVWCNLSALLQQVVARDSRISAAKLLWLVVSEIILAYYFDEVVWMLRRTMIQAEAMRVAQNKTRPPPHQPSMISVVDASYSPRTVDGRPTHSPQISLGASSAFGSSTHSNLGLLDSTREEESGSVVKISIEPAHPIADSSIEMKPIAANHAVNNQHEDSPPNAPPNFSSAIVITPPSESPTTSPGSNTPPRSWDQFFSANGPQTPTHGASNSSKSSDSSAASNGQPNALAVHPHPQSQELSVPVGAEDSVISEMESTGPSAHGLENSAAVLLQVETSAINAPIALPRIPTRIKQAYSSADSDNGGYQPRLQYSIIRPGGTNHHGTRAHFALSAAVLPVANPRSSAINYGPSAASPSSPTAASSTSDIAEAYQSLRTFAFTLNFAILVVLAVQLWTAFDRFIHPVTEQVFDPEKVSDCGSSIGFNVAQMLVTLAIYGYSHLPLSMLWSLDKDYALPDEKLRRQQGDSLKHKATVLKNRAC